MLEPIGTKATTTVSDARADAARVEKITQVAQASAAKAAGPSSGSGSATVSLGAQAAAKAMAASPPVDRDRVAQIKKAVQDGNFPIFPATIADRLIAFEQGWRAS